jgi:hypothetical protein
MNIWRNVLFFGTFIALVGCDSSSADEDDDDTNNSGFFPEDSTGGGIGGNDYGPENSWFHASETAVPTDLAGTGQSAGDIAANLYLTDQFGDDVELYQFYGQAVLLDVYAEW